MPRSSSDQRHTVSSTMPRSLHRTSGLPRRWQSPWRRGRPAHPAATGPAGPERRRRWQPTTTTSSPEDGRTPSGCRISPSPDGFPSPRSVSLHERSLATVLLAPDRYAITGQFTHRTFEAVLAGCLPLVPDTTRTAATIAPAELLVHDGEDVTRAVTRIRRLAGTTAHAQLIGECVRRLEVFRLSRQLRLLDAILGQPSTAGQAPSRWLAQERQALFLLTARFRTRNARAARSGQRAAGADQGPPDNKYWVDMPFRRCSTMLVGVPAAMGGPRISPSGVALIGTSAPVVIVVAGPPIR